jgi:hypothetical protein
MLAYVPLNSGIASRLSVDPAEIDYVQFMALKLIRVDPDALAAC